jgi:tripartite-type tricarboxylate transporter receptor subunit TctC
MSKFLNSFLCIFLLFSTNSYSQSNAPYPNKPIRIIVPFAAGGAGDTAARVLSQKLSTILNQSVLIENKPGAGAQIGTQFVANSAPDGYTILAGSSAIVVNPALNASTATYHPEKDFTPIVIGATQPMVIVVNQTLGVKSFNQLKEIAVKQKLSFASAGAGTQPHVACERIFNGLWKLNIPHIPYKGISPAITGLVGGEVPIYCGAPVGITQFVKQGKLQVLLVTSEARVANFPDTPTVIELGLPEMKDDIWQGFFAPAKTPPAIIQKLNQALNQALKSPEVIEKLEQNDFVMLGGTPKQASDFISTEVIRWGKIATEVSALPMQ